MRGDLVFWQGHVGILADPATLLHASGYQMVVVLEPLETPWNGSRRTPSMPSVIRRIG